MRRPGKKVKGQDTHAVKFEHAFAYQLKVVESLVVDFTAKSKFDNYVYLPYGTLKTYFGEYEYMNNRTESPIRASYSTFRRAFEKLKQKKLSESDIHVRLSGGSGKSEYDVMNNVS